MAIQRLGQTNTDWFKLLTRNSFSHNHNLSISGGSEKIVYNVSWDTVIRLEWKRIMMRKI